MILSRAVTSLLVGLAVSVWSTAAVGADEHPPDEQSAAEQAAPQHDHEEADQEQAGHGGHGEVSTNPLEFKTDLAIWTAIIFLVLMMVLGKFAWGPIAAGLDKREHGIADQIAAAEKTNEDARSLLGEYQQKLAQSKDEIRQMLEDAKADAQKAGDQIVEKARDEARAEHQRAVADIELATDDAIKQLAEKSASLVVDLAGKIVHAHLDPAAHSRLIQEAMAGFSRADSERN